jgi:hypothetical protein
MSTKKTVSRDRMPSRWDVPPVCQGQIVEYAYGWGEAGPMMRTTDRSDGSVTYYMSRSAARWSEKKQEAWDPINKEPNVNDWIRVELAS